jgi:hypothetical protein
MIAAQPMSPNPMRYAPIQSKAEIEPETERSETLPANEPAEVTTKLWLLDGEIVNEAIPAFFVGRNMEGFWVARDVNGQIGGIFLLKKSAVSFARRNCRPAGCATIFPSGTFEFDLENEGNPLVAHLGWLRRFSTRPRQRMASCAGKMTEAVKRRLKDLQVL